MNKFSVLISVYRNDKAKFVRRAVESVTIEQTRKPDEVVLVVDGPVPDELAVLVRNYEQAPNNMFRVIWLPENKGLGYALRVGVENASNEIIARMDSDDVSVPDRFDKQISYLEQHPECDVLGGQISEFMGDEENIVSKRMVPCETAAVMKYLKKRCPFNHMSVAMRKESVLKVGNYKDWFFNEDYYLWIRMTEAGCRFANLPNILVNVRVGADMYARRGGLKYFHSEARLQGYMLRHRIISLSRYCYNVLGRFVVQVAMPNSLRGFIFQKLFRK